MSLKLEGTTSKTGKYRRSTSYDISFPTMPSLTKKPNEATLIQKSGNHDVLVLTYSSTSELWFENIPTGLPIRFSWTQSGVTNNWHGYVSSISKVVASREEKTMELHCVGSSFPLKQRANRVFTDKTVTEVIEILAKENGMTFIGDAHERKFPQLTMAGHSYWEWIQEQAQRIGYVAFVDSSTLYFRKLGNVLQQRSTSVPILSMQELGGTYGTGFLSRTLEYFKVLKGDYIEDGSQLRSQKMVAGVNPITAEMHTSSGSPQDSQARLRTSRVRPLFSEYRSDQVILNDRDSKAAAELLSFASAYNIPAKVHAQGDSRLHPYFPVIIQGTGKQTDGYWLVREVVHTFKKQGSYMVDMTIVTDGIGQSENTFLRESDWDKVNKVNISEMLSQSSLSNTTPDNSEPQIRKVNPTILPSEEGFAGSPALWTRTAFRSM